MPMRKLLEYQADQIETVLASHNVPCRVFGGTASARLIEFHLAPAPGIKISRIEALAEELAMYLGASSCRILRRGSVIVVEVPRGGPHTVRLLDLMQSMSKLPPYSACLGADNDGRPILLRLSSPEVAHALVCGTTGSGKTELAKSMILSLALSNPADSLRLLLVDPKARGYTALGALPHLIAPVVVEVEEARQRLTGLLAEMERRDRLGEAEPRIVVFVDELADLMMVGGKEMIAIATRLAQRGREAGIHLVACTQKPTAAIVGGLVKSNFPARLVGSVASADDARIAAGIPGCGAERLAGRGDFLLVIKGEVRRFQAAYLPGNDVSTAVARLARARSPSPFSFPAPGVTPTDRESGRAQRAAPRAPDSQPAGAAGVGKGEARPPAGSPPEDEEFVWRQVTDYLRYGTRGR